LSCTNEENGPASSTRWLSGKVELEAALNRLPLAMKRDRLKSLIAGSLLLMRARSSVGRATPF
jgi:hypothetical protein